ncbi:helix-turn-helix domain-containing protein [Sediminibacillus sp. JSM 1682029]|uniref:helix-turn-helix domain-containing protein n=1 Tax=Sediminibacillus sp. JSM 1682029 TaxID=3229857 RepID=UPI003525F098
MATLERVKELCKMKGITVSRLEEELEIPKNTIYQWKRITPSLEKIEKVADYFDVSTDYLLGRTDKKRYYDLTEKDERDIQKELESMLENMNSDSGFAAFDGSTIDDMDEEDRELLIASLEQSLRIAKRIAKQKFTPKKHRN